MCWADELIDIGFTLGRIDPLVQDLHGLLERTAFHKHEKIDGVTFEFAGFPDPVMLFDDQRGMILHQEIAAGQFSQRVSSLAQHRFERDAPCGTDARFAPVVAGCPVGPGRTIRPPGRRCAGRSPRGQLKGQFRQVIWLPPVRLHQHAVDLLEVDGLGAVADGLEHGAEAQVARAAQDALGGAHDQVQGLLAEGVVPELDAVELGEDEGGRCRRGASLGSTTE